MEVGLGPEHIVLDWDPVPPSPERGHCSPFLAHVCHGQMAGWIKMPLGTMVGLGPGKIVLHVYPVPPPRGTAPSPNFDPCLLWPNGWMDQDTTWYEDRPLPRCYTGTAPTNFRPMSIETKRLPVSAPAEHL